MPTRPHSRMQASIRRFASEQRSSRTAKTYGDAVSAFLSFTRQRTAPRQRDVEAFINREKRSGKRTSIAARNQALAAIRAFARFAVRNGVWVADPTEGLGFVREPAKDPAVLHAAEVRAFFGAIRGEPGAQRSRSSAILAVLFATGLRVSELTGLNLSQIDFASSTIVAVRRKGGRVQDIPLAPEAVHLIRAWLHDRPSVVLPTDGALFVSRRGGRLSVRSVERLFERLRERVGTAKHATPHTARHSFITLTLAQGADVTVVSHVAGHASVTTTMRYRHLTDAEPRKVVALAGAVIPVELPPAEFKTHQNSAEAERLLAEKPPANDSLDHHDHLDDIGRPPEAA